MEEASPGKRKANIWLNLVCFLLPLIVATNPPRLIRYFSSSTVHVSFDWFFLIVNEENRHLLFYQTALAVLAAVLMFRATSTIIRSAAKSVLWGIVFSIVVLSAVGFWIFFAVPEPQDRTPVQQSIAPRLPTAPFVPHSLSAAAELGRSAGARGVSVALRFNEHKGRHE